MPIVRSKFARGLATAVKPLARSEAARASKVALQYLKPELARDGMSRFRILGAELSISRPKGRETVPRRQIEVLIVDYLNRRHLRILVEKMRVVEVRTLEHQPAFSSDEIEEATKLAATVPELRRLSRQKKVFVSAYFPGRCEAGNRNIGLDYISTGREGLGTCHAAVEIDLVEQRVLATRLPGQAATTLVEGGKRGKLR